jgi:hypothetical protein
MSAIALYSTTLTSAETEVVVFFNMSTAYLSICKYRLVAGRSERHVELLAERTTALGYDTFDKPLIDLMA